MAKADEASNAPILPSVAERMPIAILQGTHPAVLTGENLLDDCELRTQRRSGPGGQHRNKTSSGVFLHHRPTEIVGEATERRSQAHNREVALERLRYRLAVEIRTVSAFDVQDLDVKGMELESGIREKYYGRSLKMNDSNKSKPAVLALLLNDLHASGGQPSAVAKLWSVSTSGIVTLVKSNHAAFQLLNQFRGHHGRRALK